jgi:hypothetical protein
MTTEAKTVQGAGAPNTDDGDKGKGNPSPNPDMTAAELAAAEKAAADKAAADKVAAEEAEAAARAASEAKEDDPEGEAELDTETWGTTGDEVGDSVLMLLQTSGVEPDVAKSRLYDAVKEGDQTKIVRDALVEKVGKVNANLILAGVENFVSKNAAKIAGIAKEVHSVAGGKEAWDKVAAWVSKNVPDDKRGELASMIDEGGAKARFAASEFLSMYNADEKNTSLGSTTRVDGDAKAPSNGRAIDRRTYAQELEKAHRNNASPAVLKEIQTARERGRKRGL